MDLLTVVACGSVDDGKSTLIGRLLYETGNIATDEAARLEADSARHGTTGGIDYALLLDGLAAEREQGITIDVAWRHLDTPRRRYLIADAPGHEQYTRNMATAASTADVALILVDARRGFTTQTRRHAFIARLMGARHAVLAVNKIDLVGCDHARFDAIVAEATAFAASIGLAPPVAIPLSGLGGDNIAAASPHTPWYDGPTLLAHLAALPARAADAGRPFRMAVQTVLRPSAAFRGFAGRIASGTLRPGDRVVALPSGRTAHVDRIVGFTADLASASAGQSIALTLDSEIDLARGDLLAAAAAPPELADQFEAHLVWLADTPLMPGRAMLARFGTRTVGATLAIRHRIDPDSLTSLAARHLDQNHIAVVTIALDRAVPFAPYDDDRALGGFLVIDPVTGATQGAGMIRFALRRADNLHWQALDVTKAARAALNGQRPCVLWLTGLSGAGKSTIANLVEKRLLSLGRRTYLLDGDNVRMGLNRDLGFTEADRVENIRRVAEVARLMVDAGLIVLTAFISPFRAERAAARARFAPGEFVEIFVDTPLAEAERRDVKGLYAKARAGRLANFTGIDQPYEAPLSPEIVVDTLAETPEAAAERIVAALLEGEGGWDAVI